VLQAMVRFWLSLQEDKPTRFGGVGQTETPRPRSRGRKGNRRYGKRRFGKGHTEQGPSMRGIRGRRPAFFSHLSYCECCVLLRLEIELVNAAAGNAWLVIETCGGRGRSPGRACWGSARGVRTEGTGGRVFGFLVP